MLLFFAFLFFLFHSSHFSFSSFCWFEIILLRFLYNSWHVRIRSLTAMMVVDRKEQEKKNSICIYLLASRQLDDLTYTFSFIWTVSNDKVRWIESNVVQHCIIAIVSCSNHVNKTTLKERINNNNKRREHVHYFICSIFFFFPSSLSSHIYTVQVKKYNVLLLLTCSLNYTFN